MSKKYKEIDFEEAIERHLLDRGGYTKRDSSYFDPIRGMDLSAFIDFVMETQSKEWESLHKLHKENTREILLEDLCRALNSDYEGCLKVLRHGFKCFGKTFKAAYFAPANKLNPDTRQLYSSNKLTITRQLKYSHKNENSIDIVLGLNGLPLVTMELKNPMTGQTWRNAVHQYKHDRDPREILFQFKKRTLVHFAVDTDEVYMATQLKGSKTYFLPFNLGNNNGAGNPENPDGYKTSYLWEEILQRDSLMDIVARFIHLETKERKIQNKKIKKETVIFPRYHQLDCVRKLVASAKEKETGVNYLVQHSAGSGKSNSIAWLTHRLATLFNDKDEKIFDSVIVVTDRLVLDQQLQNTIYQFEHKQGVVEKINKDSTQLAKAISSGVPIIVTTLQKFPFVAEKMEKLRKYAVIVDEAHSAQGGESAASLKEVLASATIKEEAKKQAEEEGRLDYEEEIIRSMKKRGHQSNISFFAFTATPKYKTLEIFGVPGEDRKPRPFHLYSMKQAIEEGFILDVLEHYTTYKVYYKLIKSIEDDPEVDKKKAARALARFMSLHPHNISQKTEVIIEHFRQFTRHKIGNKAKAMVVTSSRLHAVRYKREFDRYLSEKGYTDIKTLVAFSGTVIDPDIKDVEYTEVKMNKGIREKELPEKFASMEYQVLLVAEKYQTGFDQPLLHTMYIDKKLSGIQAVQTLSRLNRTCVGKEDTFVLDFVNEPEDIQEAFQPYYEKTLVGEQAEAKHLYELQSRLDSYQIYYQKEVEEFCRIFYRPKKVQTQSDHGKMNACIDPAVSRFKEKEESEQEEFRKVLIAFRNLYSFLSQIIPFQDSSLEKLYSYIRYLLKKLPRKDSGPSYHFDDEINLKYYRLQKISEGSISLESGQDSEISGPTSVGTGKSHEETIELSQLIDILNEQFGTNFTQADQLFLDSIREDAVADSDLRESARANSMENFGYVFLKKLENLFIERMEQNEDMTAKFMNEQIFKNTVEQSLLKQVYEQINTTQTD